ncbi:hypothetical protein [Tateyamaria pelophila]|nr:hypothetical protein [Tateyamaria pelophila]
MTTLAELKISREALASQRSWFADRHIKADALEPMWEKHAEIHRGSQ